MSKILLTGFDAFGHHSRNPSQEVVEALARGALGSRLVPQVLPTSYRRSYSAVLEQLIQQQPELVLMLGVAPGLSCCRLELQAANRVSTQLADNDGFIPREMFIDPEAPLTLATTLDVNQLHHDLGREGVRVILSQDCGSYVCNALYFRVLRHLRQQGLNSKALFVHVPDIYAAAQDDAAARLAALEQDIARIIALLDKA